MENTGETLWYTLCYKQNVAVYGENLVNSVEWKSTHLLDGRCYRLWNVVSKYVLQPKIGLDTSITLLWWEANRSNRLILDSYFIKWPIRCFAFGYYGFTYSKYIWTFEAFFTLNVYGYSSVNFSLAGNWICVK